MTLRPTVRAVTARIQKRNGKARAERAQERSGRAFRWWTGGTRQWLSSRNFFDATIVVAKKYPRPPANAGPIPANEFGPSSGGGVGGKSGMPDGGGGVRD